MLGRDAAAPATIRFWAFERIRLGKNKVEDLQIQEALACASAMDTERGERVVPYCGSIPGWSND